MSNLPEQNDVYSEEQRNTTEEIDTSEESEHELLSSRSRRIKALVLVVILTLLFLVGGGYLAIRMAGVGDTPVDYETSPTDRLPEAEEEIVVEEGENPFRSAFEEDIVIPEDSINVSVEGDSFVFSDIDLNLVVNDSDANVVETSGADCVLPEDNSICYAGYISTADNTVEVFAVKNIAENRLFEASSGTEATDINGAHASFSGALIIESEEYGNYYTGIAGENGSGFLLFVEEGTTVENLVSIEN